MIPVIDLFAGPGGLGEGFSAFRDSEGEQPFKIALSVEKDAVAHETLKLRSFFRQFSRKAVPEAYYDHLRGKIDRDQLYKLHVEEARRAEAEAWNVELGNYRKVAASMRSGFSPDVATSDRRRSRSASKDSSRGRQSEACITLHKEHLVS